MKDILKNKNSLNVGIKEAKQGKYHLVKWTKNSGNPAFSE
jgi:hypothetical protein